MALVRVILVKLGVAVLFLGCYSEADLCIDEGTPCKQNEPVGCTQRAVCNDTEIRIGEDESGCKQCQKPCSEKIYLMYSSLTDNTPATGWYTYKGDNMFDRHIESDGISFFLRKYDKWTLTEVKTKPSYVRRVITHRIELSYKNDTRTIISLNNYGIDEKERKSMNKFIAPIEKSAKLGTPYKEKLVIFCPGKCLCKKFEIVSLSNYCFEGEYERKDSNRSKRFAFPGFTPLNDQQLNDQPLTDQSTTEKPNKDSATNDEQNNHKKLNFPNSLLSADENNDSSMNTEHANEDSINPNEHANPKGWSAKNEEKHVHEQSIDPNELSKNPNGWFAVKEEEHRNWKKESYIFTGESYDDEPFEFIFDEELQVWFVGRGRDDIAAVIPEASPCPELIQKQPWYVIDEDYKLKKGGEFYKVKFICNERG